MRLTHTNRLGPISRFFRRRATAALPPAQQPPTPLTLPLQPDVHSPFANNEEADRARAHAAQRSIESKHNRGVQKRLPRLGAWLVELYCLQLRLLERVDVAEADHDRHTSFLVRHGAGAEAGRHMGKLVRLVLVLGLALIDVAAYRAAVEFVFDLHDDVAGRIESSILALLSGGMVIASAAFGERLAEYHAAMREDRGSGAGREPVGRAAAARRELRHVGVPALVAAAALLLAGSAFRVQTMGQVEWWTWIAVPLFTSAALVGAFLVEWRWADQILDERDQLEAVRRRSERRRDRAQKRAGRAEQKAMVLIVDLSTRRWIHEPNRTAQLELSASRVAQTRAERHDLFHPFGPSVTALMQAHQEESSTMLGVDGYLSEKGLTIEATLERARQEHERRRSLRRVAAGSPDVGVLPTGTDERHRSDPPASQGVPFDAMNGHHAVESFS
jgi:hypothetical protein